MRSIKKFDRVTRLTKDEIQQFCHNPAERFVSYDKYLDLQLAHAQVVNKLKRAGEMINELHHKTT